MVMGEGEVDSVGVEDGILGNGDHKNLLSEGNRRKCLNQQLVHCISKVGQINGSSLFQKMKTTYQISKS